MVVQRITARKNGTTRRATKILLCWRSTVKWCTFNDHRGYVLRSASMIEAHFLSETVYLLFQMFLHFIRVVKWHFTICAEKQRSWRSRRGRKLVRARLFTRQLPIIMNVLHVMPERVFVVKLEFTTRAKYVFLSVNFGMFQKCRNFLKLLIALGRVCASIKKYILLKS